MALGYSKLPDLGDFEDPDLRNLIKEMSFDSVGLPDYPAGREHRKDWEIAMTARALRDHGALHEDSEILGVGAGREATIFWLTRHVRRVFATDLYLSEDSWSQTDSGAQMVIDPAREVPIEWEPRRLVVQHMNALELQYEDQSFDGIFSSGSIEHFGDLPQIRQSVAEMYRVLRPGGVAAIATEYRLAGPPPGMPGTVLFDEQQLREVLLEGLDWELASPLELSQSEETLASPVSFADLFEAGPGAYSVRARIGALLGRGPLPTPRTTTHLPTPYPHLVLRQDPYMWTSVLVTVVKPNGT